MNRRDYEEFQADFKSAVLSGSMTDALAEHLAKSDGLSPDQRLSVHYNNFRESLSGGLAGIFPALETFVGKAFVEGALKEYCTSHPPVEASLAGYGAGFADFLEGHKATEKLPYTPDLIRLEWGIHSLQLVDETIYPLGDIDMLSGSKVKLELSANVRLVESLYPLMSLWSAAAGQIPPEAVHLEQGGQTVAVLLKGGSVNLMALDTAEREALSSIMAEEPVHTEDLDESRELAIKNLIEKSILIQMQL